MTLDSIPTVFYVLNLAGVGVCALSGALAAARANMDVFGFILLGLATGLGGGTLRDVLLDTGPVFWVNDLTYIFVGAGMSVIGFYIAPRLESRLRVLVWADAFGLAAFCVAGAEKAWNVDASPLIVVLMGGITASFGGVIRDVLCNEVPLLFRREIYFLAAVGGAGCYLGLRFVEIPPEYAMIAGALVAFAIRGVAIWKGLTLPAYNNEKGA